MSDDLKEYQMMFGFFDEGMPLDHEAEEHVEDAHPKAKARMRRLWLPLSLAASIALLIGLAIPWVGRQTGHQDDSISPAINRLSNKRISFSFISFFLLY